MDDRSKAGLLNDNPISFDILEILIPPNAVSCGVLGKFKKLNTVFPPSVWAELVKTGKQKITIDIAG